MNGSQALKNALGNPVLLSPPLFFHPDTTGMSTISGENENQIAYQELTIWGSWLLPPSPLPDVSSLPLTTWYWVVVSPVSPSKSVFMLQPSTFPQVLHFLRTYPPFPSVSLGLRRLHLFVWLPPPPPFSAPLNMNSGPRNKERRPRGKCVSLRLARYPSCMRRDRVSAHVSGLDGSVGH